MDGTLPQTADIAIPDDKALAEAFTKDGQMVTVLENLDTRIDAFQSNVTDEKGREALKSFIYKIRRSKTAIDDAGKKINEDAQKVVTRVDGLRRKARDHLDGKIDNLKKPLDEWEEVEKKRVGDHLSAIDELQVRATQHSSTEEIMAEDGRIATLFKERDWQEFTAQATETHEQSKARITELHGIAEEREEAERQRAAELEKARQEAEEARKREAELRRQQEEREAELQAEREAQAKKQREAEEERQREAEAAKQREAEKDAEIARLSQQVAAQQTAAAKPEPEPEPQVDDTSAMTGDSEQLSAGVAAFEEQEGDSFTVPIQAWGSAPPITRPSDHPSLQPDALGETFIELLVDDGQDLSDDAQNAMRALGAVVHHRLMEVEQEIGL